MCKVFLSTNLGEKVNLEKEKLKTTLSSRSRERSFYLLNVRLKNPIFIKVLETFFFQTQLHVLIQLLNFELRIADLLVKGW